MSFRRGRLLAETEQSEESLATRLLHRFSFRQRRTRRSITRSEGHSLKNRSVQTTRCHPRVITATSLPVTVQACVRQRETRSAERTWKEMTDRGGLEGRKLSGTALLDAGRLDAALANNNIAIVLELLDSRAGCFTMRSVENGDANASHQVVSKQSTIPSVVVTDAYKKKITISTCETTLSCDSLVSPHPPAFVNALHLAALHGYPELVDLLLQRGIDVSPRQPSRSSCDVHTTSPVVGNCPLHIAVERRHVSVTHLLCRAGADVNARNPTNDTPLMLAVKSTRPDWDIIDILVQFGASLQSLNNSGLSALTFCSDLTHFQQFCVDELLAHACDESGREFSTRSVGATSTRRRTLASEQPRDAAEESVTSCAESSLAKIDDQLERNKLILFNRKFFPVRPGLRQEQVDFSLELSCATLPPSMDYRFGSQDALQLLGMMARNTEIAASVVQGLLKRTSTLMQNELHSCCKHDRPIAVLVNNVRMSCIADLSSPECDSSTDRRQVAASILSSLLELLVQFVVKGPICYQFTALLNINKIVDAAVLRDYLPWSLNAQVQLHDLSAPIPGCSPESDVPTSLKTFLEPLSCLTADTATSILHNAITLHKRVLGKRLRCTPSRRSRRCAHHCLQLLSARLILFLTHSNKFRKGVATEANLNILIQALDSTHDPHLLCFVLQTVAIVALDPQNHQLLMRLQVDEMLIQLLLPSDEWFYTNHSTLWAAFVKHHAARILVYCGLGAQVGDRVNIFNFPNNMVEDKEARSKLSADEIYIVSTCMAPQVVGTRDGERILSVEKCALQLVEEIGSDSAIAAMVAGSTNDPRRCSSSTQGTTATVILLESHAMKQQQEFAQLLITGMLSVIDYRVLIRLVAHKLLWDADIAGNPTATSPVPRGVVEKSKTFSHRHSFAPSRAGSAMLREPAADRLSVRRTSSLKLERRGLKNSNISIADERSFISDSGTSKQSRISSPRLPRYLQSLFKTKKHHIRRRHHRRPTLEHTTSTGVAADLLDECSLDELQRQLGCKLGMRRQSNLLQRSCTLPGEQHQHEQRGSIQSAEMAITEQTLRDIGVSGIGHQSSVEADLSPMDCLHAVPLIRIESRRASALSQYSYGYGLATPDSLATPLLTPMDLPFSRRSSNTSASSKSTRSLSIRSGQSIFSAECAPDPTNSLSCVLVSSHRRRSSTVSGITIGKKMSISPPAIIAETIDPHPAELVVLKLLICEIFDVFGSTHPISINTNTEMNTFTERLRCSPTYSTLDWINYLSDILTGNCDQLASQEKEAELNREYFELREHVVNGSLPCSREEATVLASIQLRIEDNWPDNRRQNVVRTHMARGQWSALRDITQKIMVTPWEVDPSVYNTCSQKVDGTESARSSQPTLCQSDQSSRQFRGCNPSLWKSIRRFGAKESTTTVPHSSGSISFEPLPYDQCLPPAYRNAGRMARNIKDHKRRLFHTPAYDSELGLKQLYVQMCKRLPAHACRVFAMKELRRMKGPRKVSTSCLLCLSCDKVIVLDAKNHHTIKQQRASQLVLWRLGGGVARTMVVLEFKGTGYGGTTRWTFTAPSPGCVRSIGMTLWEIMQSLSSVDFLPLNSVRGGIVQHDCCLINYITEQQQTRQINTTGEPLSSPPPARIMQTPMLSFHRAELERLQTLFLFPEEIALQLTRSEADLFYSVPGLDYIRYISFHIASSNIDCNIENPSQVQKLVQRFAEVSAWATHIVLSQPTHDERRTILACVLRTAETCWNLGNFNTAAEMLVGLKSEKLKSFWAALSHTELENLHKMCDVILSGRPSSQYADAINRALEIPDSVIVPFIGTLLRDLCHIMTDVSNVSTAPDVDVQAEGAQMTPEPDDEDHFSSFLCPGGMLNTDKIVLTHELLKGVDTLHEHYHMISNTAAAASLISRAKSSQRFSYQPIQSLVATSGVTLIRYDDVDLNLLQRIQHGTAAIHYDPETSRSVLCHVRLDASCGLVMWQKHLQPLSNSLIAKFLSGYVSWAGLEEGYVEVSAIKNVTAPTPLQFDVDSIYRRHCVEESRVPIVCVGIVHGETLADNDTLYFIAPELTASTWLSALDQVQRALQRECLLRSDRRPIALKKMFLDLYYENHTCLGPTPEHAIRAFGGRTFWKDKSAPAGSDSNGPVSKTSSIRRAANLTLSAGAIMNRKKCRLSAQTTLTTPSDSMSQQDRRSNPSKSSFRSQRSLPAENMSQVSPLLTPRIVGAMGADLADAVSMHSRKSLMSSTQDDCIVAPTHPQDVQDRHMAFVEFVELYKIFSIRMRKDLRDLFNDHATRPRGSTHKPPLSSQRSTSIASTAASSCTEEDTVPALPVPVPEVLADEDSTELTRNSVREQRFPESQRKIYNALSSASIQQNCAGVDTSRSSWLTIAALKAFLVEHQMEAVEDEDVMRIISTHEADAIMRSKGRLSFEGFARFMLDRRNFIFPAEDIQADSNLTNVPQDMCYPLSYYYIASSHNTYLTGHQLKGDSSVELYRQVLLTGCRCIEMDTWDGEDGTPVIYHGHTFTSKIGFRQVVETIMQSAFVRSTFPVIISIENHCSVQQQIKMAQIFKEVFGDTLVTSFIFEEDLLDNPSLPSPAKLQNRILLKNKKLVVEPGHTERLRHTTDESEALARKPSKNVFDAEEEAADDDDDFDEDIYDYAVDDAVEKESPKTMVSGSPDVRKGTKVNRDESFSSDSSKAEQQSRQKVDCEVIDEERKKTGAVTLQIAKEFSDLICYCQATKFKGFAVVRENNASMLRGKSIRKTTLQALQPAMQSPLIPESLTSSSGFASMSIGGVSSARIGAVRNSVQSGNAAKNVNAACYQVPSLNETHAKKLSRKDPLHLIEYTRSCVVRTYPAGMRIDSSNFNPLTFWAFGLQMVALNYQTPDTAMALNSAMFEQNASCGYTLKPRVMWDPEHPLHGRFNPWNKEFTGIRAVHLTIIIVSGQHVCMASQASPVIEVEILGVMSDCAKEKTRPVPRNATNPIWNQKFDFRINFLDLAFLRFSVIDTNTNKCTGQRIIPLKSLRPGYRHARLRTPQNYPMDFASLFIYSKLEEEEFVVVGDDMPETKLPQAHSLEDSKLPIRARHVYLVKLYGLLPDDSPIRIRILSETTARQAIEQSLTIVNRTSDTADDYTLRYEPSIPTARSSTSSSEAPPTTCSMRVLRHDDVVLNVLNTDDGKARLVVNRKGTATPYDPSYRAKYINIMSKSSVRGRPPRVTAPTPAAPSASNGWNNELSEATFLVCVHNVSNDHPHAIIRAPVTSTAQDIIIQVLLKSRRLNEDPSNYSLVEEQSPLSEARTSADASVSTPSLPGHSRPSSTRRTHRRILADNENVHQVQSAWGEHTYRFVLQARVGSQKRDLASTRQVFSEVRSRIRQSLRRTLSRTQEATNASTL